MKRNIELIIISLGSVIITALGFVVDDDPKNLDIMITIKETVLMTVMTFTILFLGYFGLKYAYKKGLSSFR